MLGYINGKGNFDFYIFLPFLFEALEQIVVKFMRPIQTITKKKSIGLIAFKSSIIAGDFEVKKIN